MLNNDLCGPAAPALMGAAIDLVAVQAQQDVSQILRHMIAESQQPALGLAPSKRVQRLLERLQGFMAEHVHPAEHLLEVLPCSRRLSALPSAQQASRCGYQAFQYTPSR